MGIISPRETIRRQCVIDHSEDTEERSSLQGFGKRLTNNVSPNNSILELITRNPKMALTWGYIVY